MILNIVIAIISYFIGSIPFAYIMVRKYSGNDIRQLGSGNVGAMNSYETTNKKWLGITVTILDALKGIISVLLGYFVSGSPEAVLMASVFAVLGHNFPIYLRFKGGRGLATGAGIFALLNPIVLVMWGLSYLAGWFIIKKNINVASVVGTVCTPLLIFYTPPELFGKGFVLMDMPVSSFLTGGVIICLTILVKHIQPLRELAKTDKENDKK